MLENIDLGADLKLCREALSLVIESERLRYDTQEGLQVAEEWCKRRQRVLNKVAAMEAEADPPLPYEGR